MTCCQDRFIGPGINSLLISLQNAFEQCGVPVCRAFLMAAQPHLVTWDTCCECADGTVGQLWVSVGTTVPELTNTAGQGPIPCAVPFDVTITAGVLRCALTVDDQGNAPDPDALSLEALAVLRDRITLYSGTRQWAADQDIDPHDLTLGAWRALSGGGCVGGEITITYRIPSDLCC